jgi:ribonucleotide reductase beta subunit family protein with ferritin-like domain
MRFTIKFKTVMSSSPESTPNGHILTSTSDAHVDPLTEKQTELSLNDNKLLILNTLKLLGSQLTLLTTRIETNNGNVDIETITLITSLITRLSSQLADLSNGFTPTRANTYTMFPLKDELSWQFYCTQECSLWSAKELDFTKDKEEFATLPRRYKELFYDLFGFFAPGDGMVSKALLRFLNESQSYEEQMFFIIQLFDELVHAESYGMTIVSIIPDEKTQNRVFGMIDTLPCIKAKGDYIEKYIYSDLSRGLRFVAAAVSEGVFFVTLFAIIFYFRSKGKMQNFIFMNEQISKDETLHRDYNCEKAKQYLKPDEMEMASTMIREGVEVELENVKYLLREPIDSAEADAVAGMTVENLGDYTKMLADQIFVGIGLGPFYKTKIDMPFLKDIALNRKTNFYEGTVGSYKKFNLSGALDWKKRAGLIEKQKNIVSRPQDVDF